MKLDWKSVLGFALSAVLLWWVLRGTDLGEVARVLRSANLWLFAVSAIVATCIFPLRARRWRTILEPVAGHTPFGPLWRSTAIGMMMNNVMPLRAGEVARAFAITREAPRVTFPMALASLAVDRIFDAIVLFGLMFAAMLSPAFPSGARLWGYTVPELAATGMIAIAALLALCFVMVLIPQRVLDLTRAITRRVLPRLEDKVVDFAANALGGLAVLRDARRFVAVFWWALLHWLVHALALWIGFKAVGLDAPFSAALFLQGALGLAVSVPSSPGFVGVFEAAAVVGLSVYGVSESLAFSWAIAFHLLTFIPITVFGVMYLARLGVGITDIRGEAERARNAALEQSGEEELADAESADAVSADADSLDAAAPHDSERDADMSKRE